MPSQGSAGIFTTCAARCWKGPIDESKEKGAETVEQIAKAIGDLRTGALSPLGDNPVMHTILLLLGGIGVLFSVDPIRNLLF